ncbi:MAG: aldolase/citrate lyase family protein [Bacteroidota bacterium]|nr:aldolase/citrate lyase family protein [Bacteroidota bacterium]
MKFSIKESEKESLLEILKSANVAFQKKYPGDKPERQPVHTVYGGANLFKSDTVVKMGKIALRNLETYAPNFVTLAKVLQLQGFQYLPHLAKDIEYLTHKLDHMSEEERKKEQAWLSYSVYNKTKKKLQAEAVEDFRIDFEDGFGNRPDDEEDETAVAAANELALAMKNKTLSPFIGIRIKPFTEDLKYRGVRTLDIFLSTLLEKTGNILPENFVVMLPKVTIPDQVITLVRLFEIIEKENNLDAGVLKMETMVEATQIIMDDEGRNPLMQIVRAAEGRMIAAHFGTYDYTASCGITAKYQTMDHPVCDFAHHMTKVALGSTGIFLSDGATNTMPIAPHRGENLSYEQLSENREAVYNAWQQGFRHTTHSLINGFYQGWDLNPAQLPMRYAATYNFFLGSYADAVHRLKTFVDRAAISTLTGDIFDDAATGQGLLNFFLKAINCGAINEEEALATGLTLDEIRTRSFYRIMQGRKTLAKPGSV